MKVINLIDFCHEIPASAVQSLTPCRLFFAGLSYPCGDHFHMQPVVLSLN